MAETSLPDYSTVWASGGDKLQPTNSKIALGWEVEIPPRQWFNWLDNKQDQAIQHIIQHGVAQWSSTIEYQAGKSFVQGSDGLIYKAINTTTNISPVSDTAGNWSQVSLSPRGLQRFTSAGTFKVPYGVTTVYLSGCAGGAGGSGGGGSVNVSGVGAGGAGGSAGQAVVRLPVTVTPGSTISVNIGAAGLGGTFGSPSINGGSGTAGGNTLFGSLLTLTGGSPGGGGTTFTNKGVTDGGIFGPGFPSGSCGQDGAIGFNGGVGSGGSGASGPFGGGGGSGRSGSTGMPGAPANGFGGGGGGGGGGYGTPTAGANGGSGASGSPGILIVEW